ncbi:hypothetical protein N403_05910 [Helicobacter pylori FD430]|nr:hypothetical protein N403_05910 [Helicobacter pylori FD430]
MVVFCKAILRAVKGECFQKHSLSLMSFIIKPSLKQVFKRKRVAKKA